MAQRRARCTTRWDDFMVDTTRQAPNAGLEGEWPRAHANLSVPALVEQAVRQGNAQLADNGALAAETGSRTGRSAKDKFIVRDADTAARVAWGGLNQPIDPDVAGRLQDRVRAYLYERETYVVDAWAGADPAHHLGVRVVAEYAWHALFAHQLFLRTSPQERAGFEPGFTVLTAPDFKCDPQRDGVRSEVAVILDFGRRTVTIAGTQYAGEIKKSVFSYLNYVLPAQDVFPMHCSANVGPRGDVALFFGLSGTGKTTLSSDPTRRLIGDDEHGWSDEGIFNFEGGCYAKTIRISREAEPEIYAATNHFGTILENVPFDPDTRVPDYQDDSLTENTRAAYPVDLIPAADLSGRAGHPRNVIFLSYDAFGVLPPVARLEGDQVRFFFLSGYTAKVAGTERGVTEPQATFSACFAEPFLVESPHTYAAMLLVRVRRHGTQVWMVNTGLVGGPYGVGRRISIAHTRAIVRAVLDGTLDGVPSRRDPVFGFQVPVAVPGLPAEGLDPRSGWSDPEAYDRQARQLRAMFDENLGRLGGG